MVRAVIFDWYGTLAHWQHGSTSNYGSVLLELGYLADPAVIERYHSKWDGVDHHEHSIDRAAYSAWTRDRLRGLAQDCGVPAGAEDLVVDTLISSDFEGPMVTYPEVLDVLAELRRTGMPIAICSNWGWDLDPFLEATGVASFVDVPVTSARAGFRKPHRSIYDITLRELGVPATEALFIGDSWAPDVLGSISVGMSSVHVWRSGAQAAPELVDGAHRVASLEEILTSGPLASAR